MKNSLSKEVYNKLLLKFLNNELVPGNVLNRRTIADELGVSVAPVLEALLQLKIEGFVESIPRKGTLVKAIHKEDVLDQLILREAIECQAARLYCGQPVRENSDQLHKLAAKIDSTAVNTPEHWKQEIAFHKELIQLTLRSALVREFLRITKLSFFYDINRIILSNPAHQKLQHTELVDQLMVEDPDIAEKIIRAHLRSGKQPLY